MAISGDYTSNPSSYGSGPTSGGPTSGPVSGGYLGGGANGGGRGGGGMRSPEFLGNDLFETEPSAHTSGWIISYADMMTIILTFFILLLSISTIAQTKYELLVQAFTGSKQGTLQEVKEKVDAVIKEKGLGGQIETTLTDKGLTLEFNNAVLFDSGEAELKPQGLEVLAPIERHLVEDLEPQYGLVIEGYTDDVPIHNERFASNWELSTSRAIHVMRRLHEAGLDRRRISVQGFADTRAASDVDIADTAAVRSLDQGRREQVRAANRRVIIRIDRLDDSVLERLRAAGLLGPEGAEEGAPPRPAPTAADPGAAGAPELGPFELPKIEALEDDDHQEPRP